jgi:hypothetical protein
VQEYSRRERLLWVLNRISTSAALRNYFVCGWASQRLRSVYPELTEEDVAVVEGLLKSGHEPPVFSSALSELGIRQ